MGCSSCQQNNHTAPAVTTSTQSLCDCACGCAEPVCPTPQPCTEITDSKCIVYTDLAISCGNEVVVTTNSSISTALNQIVSYFCGVEVPSIAEDILCNGDIIVPAGTLVQDAIVILAEYICNLNTSVDSILLDIPILQLCCADNTASSYVQAGEIAALQICCNDNTAANVVQDGDIATLQGDVGTINGNLISVIGDIALLQTCCTDNTAANVVQDGAITALQGDVSIINSTLLTLAPKYKSYVAQLTQASISDPTVLVLDNELSGPIVWTRYAQGYYQGTLVGAFPTAKTVIFMQVNNPVVATYGLSYVVYRQSDDVITLITQVNDATSTIVDDLLFSAPIEIRVYN